jgi:DegV family protein with EDD domain
MVQILTDSTADLGPELAQPAGIDIIPLYVHIGAQTFRDGVDIHSAELFRSVEQTGTLPKTAAPSISDFLLHFEGPDEVVYIGLSSQLSATIQNAHLAAQNCEPGKVWVVDSRNLTTGIGLLALKAASLRDQGRSAKEIAEQVQAMVPNLRTTFIIETMEYLHKGGRCSALQNLVGSLLHIRPVIAVQSDGTLGVKGKTRGKRQKALQFMLDAFSADLPGVDLERVFVSHTGCEADAEFLAHALRKLAPIHEVLITGAGSVISSHCGPGTISVVYLREP